MDAAGRQRMFDAAHYRIGMRVREVFIEVFGLAEISGQLVKIDEDAEFPATAVVVRENPLGNLNTFASMYHRAASASWLAFAEESLLAFDESDVEAMDATEEPSWIGNDSVHVFRAPSS